MILLEIRVADARTRPVSAPLLIKVESPEVS